MYVSKNILDKKRLTLLHPLLQPMKNCNLPEKKEKEIIDICLEFEIKNLLKFYDFMRRKKKFILYKTIL